MGLAHSQPYLKANSVFLCATFGGKHPCNLAGPDTSVVIKQNDNYLSKISANYEKWGKTAKSHRVLEASFVNIFEEFQLSTF